jgi:hypothetical protein
LLLIGTFAGVFLLKTNQVFRIGANATAVPKDLRVSNLTGSAATLTWITEAQTTDFVSFGETKNVSSVINESDDGQKFFTHSVTLTGLMAETTYYYKINSNGTNFDNNGIPWQFTTGPILSENQENVTVSGSVITAGGQPSKRAIVYVTVGGYVISTLTSDAGSFVLQLGSTRTPDLSQYLEISKNQTLLEVSIEAEGGEMSSIKIFPESANPIPAIIVGQNQDYRNLKPTDAGANPDANLDLPENSTSASKFNVSGNTTATSSSKTVILESIDEGEIVTSTQPQFFGKGPKGEEITITVHSDQVVTQTVDIPNTGSWSWSPLTALSEGAHSITISWIDTSGITRSLTKNFVVQAGEAPAFVASPSGKSPTPSAKPTVKPLISATPSATPTKTVKPTSVSTASAKPIPVTGNLTPTLMLFMMGIVIMTFSVFVWKLSKE